jgi:hypothetical protein
MNTTTDIRHLNKTLTGAAIGAALALAWILFDTGAVILLLALTALGALIGLALDQPERLIALLERLTRD